MADHLPFNAPLDDATALDRIAWDFRTEPEWDNPISMLERISDLVERTGRQVVGDEDDV